MKINPQITRREAKVLKHDVAVLKNTAKAATADGKVTKAEAKAIGAAQAKLNRDTFVATHNDARMPKLR